ncbi:hypothetical protein ACFX1R_042460 [Malus domestica]
MGWVYDLGMGNGVGKGLGKRDVGVGWGLVESGGDGKLLGFWEGKGLGGMEPLDLSISHLCFATLPPRRPSLSITRLAVNHNFFYTTSSHKKCFWISDALSLKIWLDSDLICVELIKVHEDAMNALAVSNDGTMYIGSTDCRIFVWSKPFEEDREDGSGVESGLGGSGFEFREDEASGRKGIWVA